MKQERVRQAKVIQGILHIGNKILATWTRLGFLNDQEMATGLPIWIRDYGGLGLQEDMVLGKGINQN